MTMLFWATLASLVPWSVMLWFDLDAMMRTTRVRWTFIILWALSGCGVLFAASLPMGQPRPLSWGAGPNLENARVLAIDFEKDVAIYLLTRTEDGPVLVSLPWDVAKAKEVQEALLAAPRDAQGNTVLFLVPPGEGGDSWVIHPEPVIIQGDKT